MKYLIKNKYWDLVEDYNLDKLLYLLIDRPCEINIFGSYIWINGKNLFQYHRDYDLSAFVGKDGSVTWWKHGNRHREKVKPAVISNSGYKAHWKNNKKIK